ncbi:RIB43A-like with coiled-coils protein 1 isoform X2 [Mesoplodon densirostris]|uniref:RIB43A-like with coiled-coils protein 1 isoform X2 n=1 Tax=Mesoplodon densirostris TaxID=48708 RepID=UPI0028DBAA51|nr:RIB43A-like with coiled-coils protein 1 isoform X2 [Mesoplodon densirostris]
MYKVDPQPDPKEVAAIEARRNQEKEQQSRFFSVWTRKMPMYKVDPQPDPKEVAAIEARRNQEKEQQSRFFSVWTRKMPVDAEALNSHMEEKKLWKAKTQSKVAAYDTNQAQYDMVAQTLEKEQAEWTPHLVKKMHEFRKQEKQLKKSRELDCEDSDRLWREFPAQLGDNDPHWGPASLQCFSGEDWYRATCLRMQQEEFMRSLQKPQQEQQQARVEEICTDTLSEQLRLAVELRAIQVAKLEQCCREAIKCATAKANKAQVAKMAKQQRREHQHQQEANLTKIQNQITSDLLTENPQVAQNPMAPHRVLPYCWKGMTLEQRAAIKKVQEVQHHEKEARRQTKQALDTIWEGQPMCSAQAAMKLEELNFRGGLGFFNQRLAKKLLKRPFNTSSR